LAVRRPGKNGFVTDTTPPPDDLPVEEDYGGADPDHADGDHDDSVLDRLRGTGVGVEDPNIVGDVGPTDVPPGADGPGDGLFADPLEETPPGP
jgi:hypothetical protein